MIAGFMVDISDPSVFNYTGTSVIPEQYHHLPRASGFYIGGNTPHVWTLSQIHFQSNRYKLPIWVYDPTRVGSTYGRNDGVKAVTRLKAIGVPKGCRLALDMETFVDVEYVAAFIKEVEAEGYLECTYGSASIVFNNPAGKGGYWTASWNNQIHVDNGAWADQYANSKMTGHPFDISVLTSVHGLWDTASVVTPTPAPPPAPSIMIRASYSKDGGKTWLPFSITPSTLSH